MLARVLSSLSIVVLAASMSSCIDPVHTDEMAALGPERNGVPEGGTHRPGQPCRVCHGGQGPSSTEFIIAGTVFLNRGGGLPSLGTDVVIMDSTNTKELRRVPANEVGNFFISTDAWKPGPTFPLFVKLEDPRAAGGVKEMLTPIGRNGGCGFCHYGADNEPTHMPGVFLLQPKP